MAERFTSDCGFDEKSVADVGLCVNEAMANVIRHAYRGDTNKPIVLTGEFKEHELRLRIRDWGNGVNPEQQPAKAHDPMKPGGLGLICLKSLMDGVRFYPQSQGMLLEMTKRLRESSLK